MRSAMQERYSFMSGNESVVFSENTLCKFLGVAIYLSLSSLPVDVAFSQNVFGIADQMEEWRFRKMLSCLRWPGCEAVSEAASSSSGSGFLLTQGKWEGGY